MPEDESAAPWTMTWSGAAPDHAASPAAPEEPYDDDPGTAPYAPAGDTDLADDLLDDRDGPPRPYRGRRFPPPVGGAALTTLFVAALGTLLVAAALAWPAAAP